MRSLVWLAHAVLWLKPTGSIWHGIVLILPRGALWFPRRREQHAGWDGRASTPLMQRTRRCWSTWAGFGRLCESTAASSSGRLGAERPPLGRRPLQGAHAIQTITVAKTLEPVGQPEPVSKFVFGASLRLSLSGILNNMCLYTRVYILIVFIRISWPRLLEA